LIKGRFSRYFDWGGQVTEVCQVKIIAIECRTLTISVIKNAKSCLRLRSLPLSYMQKKEEHRK